MKNNKNKKNKPWPPEIVFILGVLIGSLYMGILICAKFPVPIF